MPKDFDVFRCNQFYLEDQYYLGRKIKGVFFNPTVFKQQYFTLHHLQERGEYEVEDLYCNWHFKLDPTNKGDRIEDAKLDDFNRRFPHVRNAYHYLEKLPQFLGKDRFFRFFYRQWATSGIVMLITAIAQGYKEIYLTGIDFYTGGGTDYAFDVKNKKIRDLVPNFKKENFSPRVHSQEIDQAFIRMALKMEGLNIYAISPDSPLCEILPLAPIQKEQNRLKVLPKPEGYICDLVDLPEGCEEEYRPNFLIQKIKRILLKNNFYEQAKKNVFFILARDLFFCLRVFIVLIKNITK